MNMKSGIFLIFIFVGFAFAGADRIDHHTFSQFEPHIAVNPTNPQNLVACAIIFAQDEDKKRIDIYYSLDEGESWTVHENISGYGCGDPVVAFDPDGTAYVLYQKRNPDQALYIHKSYDGGETWGSRITVVDLDENEYELDRPWCLGSA